MLNRKNVAVVVVCLCVGISALVHGADTLVLDDGSVIKGVVQTMADGKVSIKTDFAGLLTIASERVTGFTFDSPVHVALKSGNRFFGKAERTAVELKVQTADGVLTAKPDTIVAAWREGLRDPLAPAPPQPRKWKYEVAVDVTGKTGNTEKLTTGAGFKAELASDEDRLKFYLRGTYSKENGSTTVDNAVGGVDYENFFSDRQSWYARTQIERDRVTGLDLRSTTASGYGYHFIKSARHMLRGRIGAMYLHESYQDGRSNTAPGLDLGLHHMLMLGDWGRLVSDLVYTPSIDDLHDYRLQHETTLDVPLGRSDVWKLRLGVGNEFTSMPAEGSEKLDTTYFSRLVLSL